MREITQADGSLRVRGVIGAVLVAGGVAGVIGAAIGGDGFGPLLGVAAASLLLGVLLVAPVLVPGLLGALRRPLRALNDPVGALAVSNVVRNPRRTANTATALTIGMALVGAATVLASSAQASLSDAITQSARSDYVLSGQLGYIPDGVASAVQDVAGVARVDEIRYGQVSVSGETVTALGAADDAAWTDSVTSPMKDGDLAQAIDNGEIVISASRAEEWDVQFGDTLTIAAVQGDAAGQTLQVGGILSSESILSSDVVLPAEVFAEVVPSAVDTLVTVSVTEGTDPESIRSELNDAVAPFYVVSVLTAEDWTGQLASQVDQILYILYALLGISIVIAILGIVNTLALSVIERVREIGLLRAVGMGQAQLAWTIILESVLIAVFGAVLGLVVGVGIASALPSILASSGLGTLSIPWGDLVGMLVLAALAGVLAALWPAARASRLPVLEAISSGE